MKTRKTLFTSDTHFGHANIIRYCERPFASADEMDRGLIERWNDVVGPDDVVYHLGDFTLNGRAFAARILRELQGAIRVLGYPWHHDRRWVPAYPGPSDLYSRSGHRVEILPPLVVERFAGQVVTLCHYPLAEWDRKFHGGWHLHGHSHGNHHGAGAIIDAGVDCHDYRPIEEAQLPELFNARDDVGGAGFRQARAL